jgi:CBS domain-containing protein
MRVSEVMTTEVLSVSPTASLKEVAELLATRGISGIPVVDGKGAVVGVLSEADVLFKERGPRPRHRFAHHKDDIEQAKVDADTAGEAMTTPAVTVNPDLRLEDAARLMLESKIKRLPVVDDGGRLVGIVTRSDLVRAFVRPDDEIENEIRNEVLLQELWLDPGSFDVTVERGEVRLEGRLGSEEEVAILERRVKLVPGVVGVEMHVSAVYAEQ